MLLFENKKEILYFLAIALFIFVLNLSYNYYKFSAFKNLEFQILDATLIYSQEKTSKNGKIYFQNFFKSADFNFYVNSKNNITKGDYKVEIPTKNIKFKNYIKGVIFTTFKSLKKIEPKPNLSQKLSSKISAQHESAIMKELFSALYLATPISKELRLMVTNWGIAHLIAISGFHLSLLFAVFYFIFKTPYSFFQERFFPYRNRDIDLSVIILAFGGFYLWLLDFTPSFFRSYLMAIFGFLLLLRGLKIFHFGNLFLCLVFALCADPSLLFSIGFYFSCLGVFFILVYIHNFGERKDLKSAKKMLFHAVFFEVFVFCAMNIPVFYFFPQASLYQMSVIPLGYAFVVFYPLSIILHIFSFGGIFDEFLLEFFAYAPKQADIFITSWEFWLFNASLLLAIKYRLIAIFIALTGAIQYFFGILV